MKAGLVEKPLALSIGLGIAAGALSYAGDTLDASREYPSFIGSLIVDVGMALGCFVFPLVVSFVARRHYFWWGFVPAGTIAVISGALGMASITDYPPLAERVSFFFRELPSLALFAVVCVSISSGPVSLIRYIIQRRRGSANGHESVAPIESAGNEGAWPPAPKSS